MFGVGFSPACRVTGERERAHTTSRYDPSPTSLMNVTHLTRFCTFATALLIPTDTLLAQVPVEPPGAPRLPGLPSGAPAPAAPAPPPAPPVAPPSPKKISSLKIPAGGTVESAVAELLGAMKAAQFPELNVLYEPGAANLPVPELNLRNVTGPDALRLIAVSADCEAMPIQSHQNAEIIGYQITQKPPPSLEPFAGGFGGPNRYPSPARPAARTTVHSAPTGLAAPAQKPPKAANPSVTQAIAGNKFSATSLPSASGDSVLVRYSEMSPAVRVYPLGGITTVVKFPEIESTLQEVLKAGSVPAENAKFALHEKTNVLVVTAPERVQALVEQFLEALHKNHAEAESAQDLHEQARRETVALRTQLEVEQQQRKNLEQELAESQARLRKLDQELSRAKDSTTKPPL